nr:hyoscyamine 6-dioxygenase-like [Tanacetum cinerariifolium]
MELSLFLKITPERRAGDSVTISKDIPEISLQIDRSIIVQQIIIAFQEFGLFQVINHGVPDEMMADMRVLYDEFFNMPVEDKLEEHTSSWPEKPTRYRAEVGKYSIEVRKMGFKILELIAEGLGLNKGHFEEVGREQSMAINHYPPCPDASLAMGIGDHTDPNLITFLQQDHYGLQLQKNGKWMGIEPIPNTFVVNLGYQLQIISNGTLKSPEHRGVLNSTASQTSIVTFFAPSQSIPLVVEPAKELVTSTTPQVFKSYIYDEFLAEYLAFIRKPGPHNGTPLDVYRI